MWRASFSPLVMPIALAALLSACASRPGGSPDNEPTLASLAARKVEVQRDSVVAVTPEQASAAYQRFLDTAPRAPQRAQALRRIGDLAMESADHRSAANKYAYQADSRRCTATLLCCFHKVTQQVSHRAGQLQFRYQFLRQFG